MPRYVPNMITTLRFFLVPLYVIVFYSDIENSLIYAILIFALAVLHLSLNFYQHL